MNIFKKWWFYLIIIVIILGIGSIFLLTTINNKDNTNNSNNSNNKVEIAKNAEILDWDEVHKTISSNGAKATDYNGKWFIYSGTVTNIQQSSCYMSNEKAKDGLPVNPITVYLPTETLKEFETNQYITVVGKFNSTGSFTDLKDAFLFPNELYNDESFIIELVQSQDKGYTPHYFKDYEFNEKGLVTKYTEISYSYSLHGSTQVNHEDKDTYELTYDDNDRLVSKKNGQQELKYTYNDDGFIEKEISSSETYTYTYEKNENGVITKGTKSGSSFGDTVYEYNEDGDIIKEIGPVTTVIYIYDDNSDRLIEKKSTFNSSGKDYEDIIYSYGVLGKK